MVSRYLTSRQNDELTLIGDFYTGGSLNPARSLGPDVINRDFPSYHWIYWVGPLLGSLLASGFYTLLCFVRWENINPGQDFDEWEHKKNRESTTSDQTLGEDGQLQENRPDVAPDQQV